MKDIRTTSILLCTTGSFHLLYNQSFVTNKSWYYALYDTLRKGFREPITDKLFSHNKSPIMIAIELNNKDIINVLLTFHIGLNRDHEQSGTPLHYACTLGRAEITSLLINHYSDINIRRKTDGFTPLHCSCRYGHNNIVKHLLIHRADVNISSNYSTPLLEACLQSQTETVEILLKKGASANKTGRNGTTPLHAAAMVGNVEIVDLLLTMNAFLNLDMNGYNPLHVACSKGHVAVVVKLLRHYRQDVILNSKTFKMSPLMVASAVGHADVVSVLLDEGADVNFFDENGITSIKLAIQNNFEDVVAILLKNGAKIDKTLHYACKVGNENLVKFLISKHADVYEVDENSGTPLHETCGSPPEFPFVVRTFSDIKMNFIYMSKNFPNSDHLLRSVKADIKELYTRTQKVTMQNNMSCLHLACYYGDKSVVSFQLENGEDVDKPGALGSTPLFIACLKGDYDLVKLLIGKGANINQPGIDGFTPLCAVCFTYANTCLKLLLKGPVNVNSENKYGFVPLHIAVKTGNIKTVKRLLEIGANINKQSKYGHTALFIACNENRFNIAELLLKNNAKVNIPLSENAYILDFVSLNGHLELAALLLKHNASVNYGGISSLAPLFFAFHSEKTDVANLLLKWKASINQKYRYLFTPLHSLINDSIQEDVSLTFILFWMFALPLIYTTKYTVLEEWIPSALQTYFLHHIIKSRSIFRPSFYLHMACSEGNLSKVEFLLKLQLDVNKCFGNGKTPLYRACENEHIQVANLLLMHGAEIDKEDENGQTPLHMICKVGDKETVTFFIKNGSSINRTDCDGQTPLYIAAQNANIEVMEYLLDNQCFVNACRFNGQSPLHASCAKNETKPVTLLLKYGINIDAIDHFGNSPLHISCQYGHCNVLELLILNNSKLNLQNSKGRTPLHTACIEGYIDIVLHLLKWGANINIRDSTGMTALYYACLNGFNNIATLLLNYRSISKEGLTDYKICFKICFENNYVDIAKMIVVRRKLIFKNVDAFFHHACISGNYIKAKFLLNFEASLKKDKDGKTPLFKAAENNHLQIVKLLLQWGADINDTGVDEMTPLFVSCVNGNKKVAEYLIEQQANIYKKNKHNILPYQAAFQLGYTDICNILKDRMKELPKSIPPSDNEHYTILRQRRKMICRKQEDKMDIKTNLSLNNTKIAKQLLAFKGLINSKDNHGRTPLHRACHAGRSEEVTQLLENGATFSTDKQGQTGLHFACLKGHQKVVRILLRFNAPINQTDTYGQTPLHFACFAGYAEIAELLLKANANVESMDVYSKSPLSMAIIQNHPKIIDVLLKYGACVNKIHRLYCVPFTTIGIALVYFRFSIALSLYEYNACTYGSNHFSFLRLDRSLYLPLVITSVYNTIFNF